MSIFSRSSEKGNVLIETALIMPILLLLVAGIIQFGFLLNAKIAVNSASYEAARAATLSDDPGSDAINSAVAYASATLPGWSLDERLVLKIDIAGTDPGDIVQVEVIYKIPIFFSNILSIPKSNDGYFDIHGSSVMRMEEKE